MNLKLSCFLNTNKNIKQPVKIDKRKSETLVKKYLSTQLFNQLKPSIYFEGSFCIKSGPAPALDHISYQLDI